MRTSEDLRAALFALEDDAPTPADVLDRLTTGSGRPARPRGWVAPAAAAAGVAAAAVVATAVVVVLHGRGAPPSTPAGSAGAVDLTYDFSVGAVPGFAFTRGVIGEGLQERTIATAAGRSIGTIQAGGSQLVTGSSALQDLRAITVSGHRAYFGQQALDLPVRSAVAGQPGGQWRTTVPVVAWSDRPGHWLVVRATSQPDRPVPTAVVHAWGRDVQARLTAVAVAVRNGEPSALRLPFRLDGVPAKLSTLTAASDTDARTPSGSAVFAEFGMEVTVEVSRFVTALPRDPAATTVAIGSNTGRVDTRCTVQPAPGPGRTAAHADCELTYRAQQWRVTIFVAGPGGGSRPITATQFTGVADHLRLAADPSDPRTWFAAANALPG